MGQPQPIEKPTDTPTPPPELTPGATTAPNDGGENEDGTLRAPGDVLGI